MRAMPISIPRQDDWWRSYWYLIMLRVANGFIWEKHMRDLKMSQRVHSEPNVGMLAYAKEKEAHALLWLCKGEVMTDLVTQSTRR